ncbi:hypothetical protein HOLleu_09114 [Holothuria leucospilota]|uniref:Centrosomal protein of 128 kDa n=1 Tax=Holothuria leucospilota TaxID=206669 RepID=A0A9Q1HIB7_HOLLE|nr:hypothetical protein HOLleu_09114 [Holothuria leucospilota]
MSSGSDEYEDTESVSHSRGRYRSERLQKPRTASTTSSLSSRVVQITRSLKDTNRNINAVDDLLDDYKDVNERQAKAIERLRENLAKSTGQLREERKKKHYSHQQHESRTLHASDLDESGDKSHRYNPTSPLREYRVSGGSSKGYSRHTPGVRFDESNDEVHGLHQAVRDLSSEQLRLGAELNREIHMRNKQQHDVKKEFEQHNESIRASQQPHAGSQSADRVEQRLKEIQNELRQQRLEQEAKERYDRDRIKESEERKQVARERESLEKEKRQMFSEVKSMVSSQRRDEEKVLREQLLEAESDKARLIAELHASRQNLERSEGTKSDLEQKIDKLSQDFIRSKEEQRSLQEKLSHYQQALEEEGIPLSRQQRREQRIRAPLINSTPSEPFETYAQQQQEIDRVKKEKEIESLRQQLTEVTSIRDADEMRSQIHKNERDREKMLEHINTLRKELEEKDKNQSKLLHQLQDMTDTLAGSEQQRKLALSRLEDVQKQLRESSSMSEVEALKAGDQKRQLDESERKRLELKTKAQNIIRQWKVKCKRLEKELEIQQQSSSQSSDRYESTVRENENLKSQTAMVAQRMENLQKEMQDILERRAEQDEQLRLKDIEINHLKSEKIALDQDLRKSRGFIDKVDAELSGQQAKLSALNEEKRKQEEQVSSLKSSNHNLMKENQQLQDEAKKNSLMQSEQLKRYTQEVTQRKDLEHKLRQLEAECETVKEESKALSKKLNEEKETNEELMLRFKQAQQSMKEREGRDIQDLARKLKRERVESEAEIQALKIELAEQRAMCKSLRKQLERNKEEFEKERGDIGKLETENIKLKRRYNRMKASYDNQLQQNEVGDNRASHLHNQVQILQETCEKQLTDYEACLNGILREVDALLSVLGPEAPEETVLLSKSPSEAQLEGHPDRWLAEIKTKLQWAKEEVKNLIHQKRKLKLDLNRSMTEANDLLHNHKLEKSFIEDELEKQEHILHQLAASRKDLEIENLEKSQALSSLQRQVSTLESHIEKSTSLIDQVPDSLTTDGASLAQDLDKLQELQSEKDRINERYLRYQNTLTLLQQQLQDAKQLAS